MSNAGRDVLAKSSTWMIDGTFKAVSSTPFSQLLMVVGDCGLGRTLPCLFALLPDKEKATYQVIDENLNLNFNYFIKILIYFILSESCGLSAEGHGRV